MLVQFALFVPGCQAEEGISRFRREVELPARLGFGHERWQSAAIAGMGQTAQFAAQPAIGIRLIWLTCEAENGGTLAHQLTFRHSARQEAQPARALPPAARVGCDKLDAPAARQPQAKGQFLLLAVCQIKRARTIEVEDADRFPAIGAMLPEPGERDFDGAGGAENILRP